MEPQTKINDNVTLRPVTDADREFLLAVYASAREIELAMVPWDHEMKRVFVENQFDAQTSYYSSEFPDARHDIITLAGEQVGRVYVNHGSEQISILDITVLSQYRCRGIGSAVVDALVAEARESDRSVGIYVENSNPSKEFFMLRGFELKEEDGVNLRLVWNPDKKS